MKMRAGVVAIMVCSGLALADVDREPPNEHQPTKTSAAALANGVDECVKGVKENAPNSDGWQDSKFCGCMFDYQRSTVKDDAKKLVALVFDAAKQKKQLQACLAWAAKDAKGGQVATETPYSKTLDLPTEVILAGYLMCTGNLEEQKDPAVPEQDRIAFCGCEMDAARAQPAAKLAKIKKARGVFAQYLPPDKMLACGKAHDMFKYVK